MERTLEQQIADHESTISSLNRIKEHVNQCHVSGEVDVRELAASFQFLSNNIKAIEANKAILTKQLPAKKAKK